jgi:hypothetical protein
MTTTNALARTQMYVKISRIHRRKDSIEDSLQGEGEQVGREGEQEEEVGRDEVPETIESNNQPINWLDFWKRARVYPETPIAYPDASQYVSSRQRRRGQGQRLDSESQPDVVIN